MCGKDVGGGEVWEERVGKIEKVSEPFANSRDVFTTNGGFLRFHISLRNPGYSKGSMHSSDA